MLPSVHLDSEITPEPKKTTCSSPTNKITSSIERGNKTWWPTWPKYRELLSNKNEEKLLPKKRKNTWMLIGYRHVQLHVNTSAFNISPRQKKKKTTQLKAMTKTNRMDSSQCDIYHLMTCHSPMKTDQPAPQKPHMAKAPVSPRSRICFFASAFQAIRYSNWKVSLSGAKIFVALWLNHIAVKCPDLHWFVLPTVVRPPWT